MAKNLVIVESPAKAKTIERFLGKDYKVASCFGHIADLPNRELGVDVDNGFQPKYVISPDKKKVVSTLRSQSKTADTVWLASDEDREGEAIAWHLADTLKLDDKKTRRIVFHEITKSAITKAIQNPREIHQGLVNAQQARRILDRLVGYELSPVLWKKIKTGLSAGRVQSVAVRLIVEREREIQNFKTKDFFRVEATFITGRGESFKAKVSRRLKDQQEATDLLESCKGAAFSVADVTAKPLSRQPAPPFTTSTLQQEASRKLGFSVSRTMTVAQRLYEAGLITYMRTDSVNLSGEAKSAAEKEITNTYGASYSKPRNYKSKAKGAQEAHEAIRPTDLSRPQIQNDRDQARLYELIWKRTIASQMSDARLERTQVDLPIPGRNEKFTATGEVIKFDGFLKVYLEGRDEEEEQTGILPTMKKGDPLENRLITATQRFTKPPYRYTEASLVRQLEELGIGRPSTYAPTISTIQNRKYVEKGALEGQRRAYDRLRLENGLLYAEVLTEMAGADKGKLLPTDIGMIVNDFLVKHFESILDYNFTARVEEDFDSIAEGKKEWSQMLRGFYDRFQPQVEEVTEKAEREKGERILGKHPESGKTVLVRLARFGPVAQIGAPDDEDKQFASLRPDQQIGTVTLEEALDLFKLPRKLGQVDGEETEVNVGRYGPYVRYGKQFISIPKDKDPLNITMEEARELIEAKKKADAPIAEYEGMPVQKGKGRFGPFIKWNELFINVPKKYDFDNLSQGDIETLIEDKKKKEREKLLREWPEESIRIEKARWGRFNLIKGKAKVELPKGTEVEKIKLEEALKLLEKKKSKR